jgi:hypothetical protein
MRHLDLGNAIDREILNIQSVSVQKTYNKLEKAY